MFIIALAGGSGSGKSLIANELKAHLQTQELNIGILCEDRYYRPLSEQQLANVTEVDFDHPDAIDHQLMHDHLQTLKNDQAIQVPRYCYQTHRRLADTEFFSPTDVLILEGLHLLHRQALLTILDLGIFIHVPTDVCLHRRIQRDVMERDRTEQSVRAQYQKTVLPNHQRYIEPSRANAHLVVDGTRPIEQSLTQIAQKLGQLLY